MVCRRLITVGFAVLDQDLGGHRTAVVVGGHHRAVGAGIEDDHQIADRRARQPAILAEGVGGLADRADDVADGVGADRPAATGSMRW